MSFFLLFLTTLHSVFTMDSNILLYFYKVCISSTIYINSWTKYVSNKYSFSGILKPVFLRKLNFKLQLMRKKVSQCEVKFRKKGEERKNTKEKKYQFPTLAVYSQQESIMILSSILYSTNISSMTKKSILTGFFVTQNVNNTQMYLYYLCLFSFCTLNPKNFSFIPFQAFKAYRIEFF